MLEWLSTTELLESSPTPQVMLLRLLTALALGCGVAGIYRASHGREPGATRTLTATLVLLSILIAMVSMTIGNNVARAFSLVGALSIVRFRTVVEDTRDTAFVIFSVIAGMAAGAGMLILPVIGLPIVAAAAVALNHSQRRQRPVSSTDCRLNVRLAAGCDPEMTLGAALGGHLEELQLLEAGTARQGAAIDLRYAGRLRPAGSPAQLIRELNQIEGVMSAELKRTS